MAAEPGGFEIFYQSFWQHPVLLWAAAIAGYAIARARRGLDPSLRRYLAALTALSLCDAWLTSHDVVGIGRLPEALRSVVPLFFVLAGDLRFFLLVTAATTDGRFRPSVPAFLAALGFTLVVPPLSQVVMLALPEDARSPRLLYWVYEVAFLVLTLGVVRRLPRVRANPWLARVTLFVAIYYGLWAAADSILLVTGADFGFALRVVPNVLYYGGLIAVIAASAPRAGPDPASAGSGTAPAA